MRRSQNSGYEPLPQSSGAHDDLENENERLAEDLKNKISSLKSLTIDIGMHNMLLKMLRIYSILNSGNEVRSQSGLLTDLDDEFGRTSGFMSNTLGKVLRLSKHKKGFTCYMLGFAIFIFFILYVFMKFR